MIHISQCVENVYMNVETRIAELRSDLMWRMNNDIRQCTSNYF